jgi:hypothetical protein
MRKKNPMENLSLNLEEAFIKNDYGRTLVPKQPEQPGMFSKLIDSVKENPKTAAGLVGGLIGTGIGAEELFAANHDLNNDLSHLPSGSKFDPDNIKTNILKTRMEDYNKLFNPLRIYDTNNNGILDNNEIIKANKNIEHQIEKYNDQHPIKNHLTTSEPEQMKNNLEKYKDSMRSNLFDLDKNGIVSNRDIDLGKDLLRKDDVKLNPLYKGLGYGVGGAGITAALQYAQKKLNGGSSGKS